MKQEKFLVKAGSKLKVIPSKIMDSLTPNQALAIGLASYQEQRRQLLEDALKGDKYYYKRKIVDALGLSIDRIERSYPWLKQSFPSLSNNVSN